MSKEEILEIVNDFLKINEIYSTNNCPVSYLSEYQKAIQGLLDLYNKEKSLNEIIKSKTIKDICYNIGEFDNRFISKEEMNKAIKELQDKLGIAEELQDKI